MEMSRLSADLVEVRSAANELAAANYAREQTGRTTGRVIYVVHGVYQVELK
jgi:hypothetical protein